MVTGGSHTCGGRGVVYRVIKSLCCIPETKITICVHHTSLKIRIKTKNKCKRLELDNMEKVQNFRMDTLMGQLQKKNSQNLLP